MPKVKIHLSIYMMPTCILSFIFANGDLVCCMSTEQRTFIRAMCVLHILTQICLSDKCMYFPISESFGDINRGPISTAGPSVARELSQEGDTHNISKVAFASGEEATAQGPSCEKERAKITTCSSLTGEEMQLVMLLFLKLQFVAEKNGAG